MSYYKVTSNDYILAIGTGNVGEKITESEYNEILSVIHSAPYKDGYGYRLKTDLSWEEYEMPVPEPVEEEAIAEDYEQALQEMGVDFND